MSRSKESSVKVGLRVRPLVSKETGQNITITDNDYQSLQFKGQTFTFDHVFGLEVSQVDLYTETAAPMLKSFLEGYNCTIMAYGQTGSGKTYTMGTSDLDELDSQSSQGLIPRFVMDLFENLTSTNNSNEKTSFKIRASFLEIYGEDVYDLIGSAASPLSPINNRVSLQVREDESNRVFVQGQNEVDVDSVESTLEVLCSGTRNRITASTAMNAGSSRSHAVFTLTLEQSVQTSDSPDDLQKMTSKLTFVDLAGSERIKRTGAEGQRLKEGIQINSGLFNLGQVINSLADEQKLKNGVKSHVPYRNSKLTHLLKDALGGNSQTLFLACVSPAESNESETQGTLTYARQARNIQNKPVKNVDKTQLEIRRLRYAVKAWMLKAVSNIFAANAGVKTGGIMSPLPNVTTPIKGGAPHGGNLFGDDSFGLGREGDEEALLRRPEVMEFVNAMNCAISDKLQCNEPSPRKVRLSMAGGVYSPSPSKGRPVHFHNLPPHPPLSNKKGPSNILTTHSEYSHKMPVLREDALLPVGSAAVSAKIATYHQRRCSLDVGDMCDGEEGLESMLSGLAVSSELAGDPEETERLVSRMMDIVSKEKEHLNLENTPPGNELDALAAAALRDSELLEVETEILEKEAILGKLMDTVRSYAAMKSDFEKLLEAIYSLETERNKLEAELEQAKKVAESTASAGGSHCPKSAADVEGIRQRFLKVQSELKAMKSERSTKESSYKKAIKDSKAADAMARDLQKLKENKVAMMKQSKLQVQQLAKLKKDQVSKLGFFKKADIKKQQMMNTLKSELATKERILAHKEKEISRISMKLKASEEHIAQLLKLQNAKNRSKISAIPSAGAGKSSGIPGAGSMSSSMTKGGLAVGGPSGLDLEFLATTKTLLDTVTADQVGRRQDVILYGKKASSLKQLNKQLLSEAYELDELLQRKRVLFRELLTKHSPPVASSDTPEESADEFEDEGDMNTLFSFDFSTATMLTASAPAKKVTASTASSTTNVAMKALYGKLSEEERYAAHTLKVALTLSENSVSRLTKMIDVYNGDIDDLSLRMEEGGGDQGGGLEPMTRDLVCNLTLPQSHLLLLDVISEKCAALVQSGVMASDLSAVKMEASLSSDRVVELGKFVTILKIDMQNRLDAAEKRRAAEVWSVLNNKDASTESLATRTAMGRADDFEAKLKASVALNDQLQGTGADSLSTIAALESKVSDLALLAKYSDSDGEQSSSNSDDHVTKLLRIWNQVGLGDEEREEVLGYVRNARQLTISRVVLDAESNLTVSIDESVAMGVQLTAFCTALGAPLSQFIDNEEATELLKSLMSRRQSKSADITSAVPLNKLLDLLTAARSAILAEFEVRVVPALHSMKDRLLEMIGDMLMDIGELPPSLQAVVQLSINNCLLVADTSTDEKIRLERVQKMCAQLTVLKATCAALPSWEAEITKLNLARMQTVSQLITLRDETVQLSAEMGFDELKQLAALVGVSSSDTIRLRNGDDEDYSADTLNMAMQLVVANSASNPPGSSKLLSALQRLKLVLESVKVNRVTVCKQIAGYVKSYTTEFNDQAVLVINGRDQLVISAAATAGVFSTVQTNELLATAEDVHTHALQQRKELEIYLSAIVFELTGNNEETIKFQITSLLGAKLRAKAASTSPLELFISGADEVMDELSGMRMFVEEAWIQSYIGDITNKWEGGGKGAVALRTVVKENWFLREELTRLTSVSEAHKELLRADGVLARHVTEMEEFEVSSKHDRVKALSGNSKLLIEEERFRKNGKKKYETLTDKMLQLFARLNALVGASNASVVSPSAASAGAIEIKLNNGGLSATGQALLKDRRLKERIELMHLNISAN